MKPAVAILVLIFGLSAFGQVAPMLVKKPPQTAEIASLVVPKPNQACRNWAWAAVVQLMLQEQQIKGYDQDYWILKSAGGELCIEKPLDLDQLKQLIDGDYVLVDGGRMHFGGVITTGAPQDVSYFIAQLQKGRTAMVLYKGRPCVLKGIEYNEYIYPNGQRMLEATKLTLIDPLAKAPVVFDRMKDDIADLGGVFEVKVEPVDPFR
jgi:hypothetical protein